MDPVLDEVKRLVARTCALDVSAVRDDGRLIEYGVDSVRAMDLLVSLEEKFDIQIPDGDVVGLRTIADVVAYVKRRVGAS